MDQEATPRPQETGKVPGDPQGLIHPSPAPACCVPHNRPAEVYCATHAAAICVVCVYKDHAPPHCQTMLLEDKVSEERRVLLHLLPEVTVTLDHVQKLQVTSLSRSSEAAETYAAEEGKVQAWCSAAGYQLKQEYDEVLMELGKRLQEKTSEVHQIGQQMSLCLEGRWAAVLQARRDTATSVEQLQHQLMTRWQQAETLSGNAAATLVGISEARAHLEAAAAEAEFALSTDQASRDVPLPFPTASQPNIDLGMKLVPADWKEPPVADTAENPPQATESPDTPGDAQVSWTAVATKPPPSTPASTANDPVSDDPSAKASMVPEAPQKNLGLRRALSLGNVSIKTPASFWATVTAISRRITTKEAYWKKRVKTREYVKDSEGQHVVMVSGPWCREAWNYLTDKTSAHPGPVDLAPPCDDRKDFFCVEISVAKRLLEFFGTATNHVMLPYSKMLIYQLSYDIMMVKCHEGPSKEDALENPEKCGFAGIDNTFSKTCQLLFRKKLLKAFVLHGTQECQVSCFKTIRHYMENTQVPIVDFVIFLFLTEC